MSQTASLVSPVAKHNSTRNRFSYSICPEVPTISALARRLRFLQEEFAFEPDLDLIIKHRGFTGIALGAYEDGLWLRDAGHVPAIWARARGIDSRLLALSWLEASSPVVTLTSAGIRSVADLKGKRLGIGPFREDRVKRGNGYCKRCGNR